jgi:hypothetical protein
MSGMNILAKYDPKRMLLFLVILFGMFAVFVSFYDGNNYQENILNNTSTKRQPNWVEYYGSDYEYDKANISSMSNDSIYELSTSVRKRGSTLTTYIDTKINCNNSTISYGKIIFFDIASNSRSINDDGWSNFGQPKGTQDKALVQTICNLFQTNSNK